MNMINLTSTALFVCTVSLLAGCATDSSQFGGRFLPGDGLPKHHNIDIASIANAVPKNEPLSKTGNRPYTVFGKNYQPLKSSKGYVAQGIASWYGTKFHGRNTSSMEPYNMYSMSAAHRTLPLPSYLKVTNLANQRTVIVKVNDRGPFVNTQRRIVDLSYAAAAKLGMIATGTAGVRIEAVQASISPRRETQPNVVKVSPFVETENIETRKIPAVISKAEPAVKEPLLVDANASYLQMGAFSVRQNAEALLQRLTKAGVVAYLEQSSNLFKVKSGPYQDADQALRQKLEVDRILNIEARVVFE